MAEMIEDNSDINPGFPASAGRTPLAKVRTFLAERRSLYAAKRTSLSRGRTGLAFLRTGVSFITVSLVLLRVFGAGYLAPLEGVLLLAGVISAIDGIRWYMPARKSGSMPFLVCKSTEPTCGTTVLQVSRPGDNPVFSRSAPAEGAEELRSDWNSLAPVMRRRFLASDRTDLAEERTSLACYRTKMARARTGLAFARTGIAFIGLGIAFLRQFHAGAWTILDVSLIVAGTAMFAEGFHWYFPGRAAGVDGFASAQKTENGRSIWDLVFPQAVGGRETRCFFAPHVKASHAPGIWGTTGLALERTLLAERRNVMARLRTVMARSRTGLAFIRTGMSMSAVGAGLMVYFGSGNIIWSVFNLALVLAGIAFIGDGLYWHLPADRIKRQFPYCFGELEISIPDYGKPAREWGKVIFSHEDYE